jgi:hypothetical protein
LTEENLAKKMEEFMSALDQVKKYRSLVSGMVDFIIIILASFILAQLLNIIGNVLVVFSGYTTFPINLIATISPGLLVSPLLILILLGGIIVGALWVDRKLGSVKGGQWKSTLTEGAPGAIKLLQELKWETIFNDIKFAKLGFVLYGALKLLVYWILAFSLFGIFWGFGRSIFHMNIDTVSLVLLPLILVLVLSRKDLRQRYEQVGRLDSLLWELRWFDSEFRRADFKA